MKCYVHVLLRQVDEKCVAAFGAFFKLEQPHDSKPSFPSDCFQNVQCHYSLSHASLNIYNDVFYAENLEHV